MPTLAVRRAASDIHPIVSSQDDLQNQFGATSSKNERARIVRQIAPARSGTLYDASNRFDLRLATSRPRDDTYSSRKSIRKRDRNEGEWGKENVKNIALISRMGGTKQSRGDRRRANSKRFSISSDDTQILPTGDDQPSRGRGMTKMARAPPSPVLPSPPRPVPMTAMIPPQPASPIPVSTTSLPTPTSTLLYTSSPRLPQLDSPSSPITTVPLQTTTLAREPAHNSATFSAGTVIALSTVLPAIIIALVVVIIYLLRARRAPKGKGDDESGRIHDLPMGAIQRPSNSSFAVLPHRSISPFDLSLHDLMFGRNGSHSKPGTASIKSHVSSDSGHANHTQPPVKVENIPPPTPVLATRYVTHPTNRPQPGQRTSIYVDRTSMASTNVSTVVFAHPQPSHYGGTDEGASTGRLSESTRDGDGLGRRSREVDEYRRSRELDGSWPYKSREGLSLVSREDTPASSETHASRGHGRSGSNKALKLLGIGPTPPVRAHLRSQSQPAAISTYSLPSLQLSPRLRAIRSRAPGETIPRVSSPLGSRSQSQRIYSHQQSASLSTSMSPPSQNRERNQLSIIVPPRLGAPIRPVAELELEIATPASPPQPLPTATSRGTPRGPRTPASQLSELGVLERSRSAFGGLGRGEMAEPSLETRERILRLLGRLPEESGPDSASGGERRPGISERERREVRRIRSESGLPAHPSPSSATTQ